MKPEEIKNLMRDLQDLHNRLVSNYNDNVPFEQMEEDRLVVSNTLDLINQYEAEIENLEIDLKAMRGAANWYKAENMRLKYERDAYIEIQNTAITEAKAEAIKEFAERLKETFPNNNHWVRPREMVDNLLKEMGVE